MKITVVAFGVARDILGARRLDLDFEDKTMVSDILDYLKNEYPAFDQLASIQMAVNEDYVSNDFAVSEGDELVLIPPVSGG